MTISATLSASATKNALKNIQKLQVERVHAYKQLDQTFAELLEDANFEKYNMNCAEVSKTFSEVSKEIRDIEAKLNSQQRESYAKLIRSLQMLEKDKLQTTMEKQKIDQQIFIEQRVLEKEAQDEEHEKHHQHNHSHGHKHKHGHKHEKESAASSSSSGVISREVIRGEKLHGLEEEKKKVKQVLAKVIEDINEKLEEIKYAVADLEEEQEEQESEGLLL